MNEHMEISWTDHGLAHPLDWVIAEGESHNGVRPMTPVATLSLRNQHVKFGVGFFSKQHGEYVEVAGNAVINVSGQQKQSGSGNRIVSMDGHVPAAHKQMRPGVKQRWVTPIGTKSAGSTLDGQEWKQFPRVA